MKQNSLWVMAAAIAVLALIILYGVVNNPQKMGQAFNSGFEAGKETAR